LVHRDFKPDNAIVGVGDRVRVLDFGLARRDEVGEGTKPARIEDSRSDAEADTPLTETGSIVGTPAYMAPEQLLGSGVDHRSDQFAFCVSLWEALCGARPYAGKTLPELSANVIAGELQPPPREHMLTPALRGALERGLQSDPAARWESMEALLAAIERGGPSKRRLGLAAIAFGGVAAVGGLAWSRLGAREDPCIDGPALLAEVWDEDRRAALRSALAGVGVGNAAATAEIVDDLLVDYAEAWVAGHRDACEAALVHRAQSTQVMDQRLRCLEDRRRGLGALATVLEGADAAVLQTAVQSATRLPAIESCADLDYVAAEVAPPDDPGVATEADRIADELALANALVAAGKGGEALPIALRSLEAARRIAYAPVLVEASNRVADAHYNVGDYDQAIAAALEGFAIADAASTPIATRNLQVLGGSMHALGRYREALAYYQKALAMATRLHGDESVEAAVLHGRIGQTLHALDDRDEGLAKATKMLDILTAAPDGNELMLALAHGIVGSMLQDARRHTEALAHHERALEIRVDRLGPTHPEVAATRVAIGGVFANEGKNIEALRWHEQALADQVQLWGPEHPEVAVAQIGIGLSLERLGRVEEALERYEESHETFMRTLGPEHPHVAQSLNNIGEALAELGRHEEALAKYEAALAIRLRAFGDDHVSVAQSHATIGNALSGLRRPDEAIEHYELGLRIEIASLGADHYDVALTREALGSALVDAGRYEEGLDHLRGSSAIFAKIGPQLPAAAWTHLGLGRALAGREGCAPAIPHYVEAIAIWRNAFGDEHPNLARPLAALALCTSSAEEAAKAREHLRRLADGALGTPVTAALYDLAVADDEASHRAAEARLVELREWTYPRATE
jgi:tetratricopeptide (TPR) repeat protein